MLSSLMPPGEAMAVGPGPLLWFSRIVLEEEIKSQSYDVHSLANPTLSLLKQG